VSPSRGLAAGARVRVTARGLPADTPVTLVLCNDEPSEWMICVTELGAATTDSDGRLSTRVRVVDPVHYRPEPAIYPQPTYCRADACRVWVTWRDEAEQPHSVGSEPLTFAGSPATVAVDPAGDLTEGQVVRVTGTAPGSDARRVEIWQYFCISRFGEIYCNGDLLGTTPLRRDDTFAVEVPIRRYVGPDREDCVDADWGYCRLVAYVLDPSTGLPDPTFGDPAYFQPGVGLSVVAG
jgi:hypothetical protein